jgi:hypothetical protein
MEKKHLNLGDEIIMNDIPFVVTCVTNTNSEYPFDKLYWFNGKEDVEMFLSDGYYITELEKYIK